MKPRALPVPALSLVVLIGPSGSGKTTFARKHFLPTEIVSSDRCRGMVADDENDQTASGPAFEVLHFVVRKRLEAGRLTVVDATNLQRESRASLLALAKELHVLPVAIVLDLDQGVCAARNAARTDRSFGPHVLRNQVSQLRRSLRGLGREGFRHVWVLESQDEVDAVTVERTRLWNDRRDDHGPFDVIGDVHGCADELVALLAKLGYAADGSGVFAHPEGRRAVFLGDLVDRGPKIPEVLDVALAMVRAGTALMVPGNHEAKLIRKLGGRDVKMTHGLAETWAQLEPRGEAYKAELRTFLDGLVSHLVLDDGNLVVAHAGLTAALQGRTSGRVREFCLYGESTGETDEYGLPVRYPWAADYRGRAMVVYGHTPTPRPEWVNRTICIDTGCVFGGSLTALRYPEKELVEVRAAREYFAPKRPLVDPPKAPSRAGDLLEAADVLGKRIVTTRYAPPVTIREELAIPALEVMSRFAVDPRWLVYLPPTMSPCETAKEGPLLERPREAVAGYRAAGVAEIVLEEKHMGSRAVLVVCRDASVAEKRFRVFGGDLGTCYTRTGRPFFSSDETTRELVARTAAAAERAGLFDDLGTGWLVLDAEILPWSAKAQELLRRQYAATAAVAVAGLSRAAELLGRTPGAEALGARFRDRRDRALAFREAYRRYCWPVTGLADHEVAPFHLLASEGAVHADRDHLWHLQTLARLAEADPGFFIQTRHLHLDLAADDAEARATAFWDDLTSSGGEGMVVKPRAFLTTGERGLVQPAVKVRGAEYLRIIYGPEYDRDDQLERLRARHLGAKRSLALREFSLGLEALHRFVEDEGTARVHECVFGVLALESEPVDPRL